MLFYTLTRAFLLIFIVFLYASVHLPPTLTAQSNKSGKMLKFSMTKYMLNIISHELSHIQTDVMVINLASQQCFYSQLILWFGWKIAHIFCFCPCFYP